MSNSFIIILEIPILKQKNQVWLYLDRYIIQKRVGKRYLSVVYDLKWTKFVYQLKYHRFWKFVVNGQSFTRDCFSYVFLLVYFKKTQANRLKFKFHDIIIIIVFLHLTLTRFTSSFLYWLCFLKIIRELLMYINQFSYVLPFFHFCIGRGNINKWRQNVYVVGN